MTKKSNIAKTKNIKHTLDHANTCIHKNYQSCSQFSECIKKIDIPDDRDKCKSARKLETKNRRLKMKQEDDEMMFELSAEQIASINIS